jgi:hypothetical protein
VGASVLAVTLLWFVLQVAGAFVHLGEDQTAISYWAHIGGFVTGLVLSVAFRAPDIGKLQADQAVLKEMGERSPGAVIAAAEQQLQERPNDLGALQDLALVHEHLGEQDKEAEALFKLMELLPEEQQGPVLERICALGRASQIPTHRRLALAERFKTESPSPSVGLLQSILRDASCESLHPDALLALASLTVETAPEKAKAMLNTLQEKYPLHPAADIARAKGLL